MTEPDDSNPLHEWVRQRLAGYQPPFDPGHWQQMRRQLRRRRWRMAGCWAAGVLVLLGVGWFAIGTRPTPPRPPKRVTIAAEQRHEGQLTGQAGVIDKINRVIVFQRQGHRVPKTSSPTLPVWTLALLMQPRPLSTLPEAGGPALPPVLVHSPVEPDIIRRVTTGLVDSDSTTYRVFARNLTRWPNAVVVCDFTSSMYSYSTQLMAWFRKNQANRKVLGLVFFTDCDSLGHETEPGQSGRMFATRSRSVSDVLPLMLASARNTMGNVDNLENVIDPLAYAQQQFPEADHIILVADNGSAVKDMSRLAELHKPVHIVLCGPTQDTAQAFQPDYYTLARQTGGSLHTVEDDLTNVAQLPANTWIRIGGRYYRRNRRGHFVATRFRHRPQRLMGFLWR